MLKRWVFRARRKEGCESMSLMLTGRLFQMSGPQTEKARRPRHQKGSRCRRTWLKKTIRGGKRVTQVGQVTLGFITQTLPHKTAVFQDHLLMDWKLVKCLENRGTVL